MKPNWLISLENTVGSNNDSITSNDTEDEHEYKQASSSNNNEMPNWLVTYRNTVGF
jgi:hypothetical protein